MPTFDFSRMESGRIRLAYPKQVGELSILQRATMAECLQREMPANGETLDFEGEEPAWADLVDAVIAGDIMTNRLTGSEGFSAATQVLEKGLRGGLSVDAIAERAEVVGHFLTPERVVSILERVARIMVNEAHAVN